MDNIYFWPKMHLYTLWFGCTTSTSREDNVWKLPFWPLGPCSWAPMGDQMHLLNKWHVPSHMNDYFFWILYLKYLNMYFLEEEIQIFLYGPLVNLYAPPPPLPQGLSGVVQVIDMSIYLWNVSNTMWFVRQSTSGCRIEDFVFKKSYGP